MCLEGRIIHVCPNWIVASGVWLWPLTGERGTGGCGYVSLAGSLGAELLTGKPTCSSLLRTLWYEELVLNLQGRGGGGHVG